MRLGQGGFRAWLSIAAAMLLSLFPAGAMASISNPGDLDDLAFIANEIIEARYTGKALEVEVTAVYQGSLTVGQKISVSNLLSYTKGAGFEPPRKGIGTSDRLFLFLAPVPTPTGASKGVFQILPYGMAIVWHGRVYEFRSSGTGFHPYVAVGASGAPRVADFRVSLTQTAARVGEWRQRFVAPFDSSDAIWQLALVKSYPSHDWNFSAPNSLTTFTIARLLQFNDPAILDQAIDANPGLSGPLTRGFDNLRGGDYLLGAIGDPSIAAHRRQSLIKLFEVIGGEYRRRAYRPGPATKPYGPSESLPSFTLASVAELAALPDMPADSAESLINWIRRQSRQNIGRSSLEQSDSDAAARVLRGLYKWPPTSERLRFAIEMAMLAIGPAAYDSLESECGPVVSRLELPEGQTVREAFPGDRLPLEYIALPSQQVTRVDLMLESLEPGGHKPFSAASASGFVVLVEQPPMTLPAKLPPGRYRAFLQFYNGMEIVSEGHSIELSVIWPQPKPPGPKPRIPPPIRMAIRNWWIEILTGAMALLLMRHLIRSRRRIGQFRSAKCIQCGYDLRASTDRCPECGTKPPAVFPIRILRSQACAAVCGMLLTVGTAALVSWVRSYWIADCVINTTGSRADAIYSATGALIFERPCIGSAFGWTYERDNPADMLHTVADAGMTPDWKILGAQRAASIGITVIPMWQIAVVSILAGYGFWRLSHAIRSSISRQKPVGSRQS